MKYFYIFFASMLSPVISAGEWYDDWETVTITDYVDETYFYGLAECSAPNQYGSTSYLSLYFQELSVRDICLNSYGGYEPTTCNNAYGSPLPYGVCNASLPNQGTKQVPVTRTEHRPIQPYPDNVWVERSSCTSYGARQILVTTQIEQHASNMKVYSASAPAYPESVVYSGAYREVKLLTVYPTSNDLNIRVKLDNGSSYYSIVRNVKCGRGGGNPV